MKTKKKKKKKKEEEEEQVEGGEEQTQGNEAGEDGEDDVQESEEETQKAHPMHDKTASRVWCDALLPRVLEFVPPLQRIKLGPVNSRWQELVEEWPNLWDDLLKSIFPADVRPPNPVRTEPARDVLIRLANSAVNRGTLFSGEVKDDGDSNSTPEPVRSNLSNAVELRIPVAQWQAYKAWKKDLQQTVEDEIPKRYLPWSLADECNDMTQMSWKFRFWGDFALVVVENEAAGRVGIDSFRLKWWQTVDGETIDGDHAEKDAVEATEESVLSLSDEDNEEEDNMDPDDPGLISAIKGPNLALFQKWLTKIDEGEKTARSSPLPRGMFGGDVEFIVSYISDGGRHRRACEWRLAQEK
tara:strand:+ start:224 stop:1288 length:1065 start_codon:yes stop_codon:yes gene_type:complete